MSWAKYISEYKHCPLWGIEVKVTARYHCINGTKIARFTSAECDIVKNLALPEYSRNKNMFMYHYCNVTDCLCLKDFPEEISQ